MHGRRRRRCRRMDRRRRWRRMHDRRRWRRWWSRMRRGLHDGRLLGRRLQRRRRIIGRRMHVAALLMPLFRLGGLHHRRHRRNGTGMRRRMRRCAGWRGETGAGGCCCGATPPCAARGGWLPSWPLSPLPSGLGAVTAASTLITVLVRCTETALTRGAPPGPPWRLRRSSGRTCTAPDTPCVEANTRGRTRYVGSDACVTRATKAGEMPGLTAMCAPRVCKRAVDDARAAQKERAPCLRHVIAAQRAAR